MTVSRGCNLGSVMVNFEKSLSDLKEASVVVSPGNGYPEPGQASIQLLFANGRGLEQSIGV